MSPRPANAIWPLSAVQP